MMSWGEQKVILEEEEYGEEKGLKEKPRTFKKGP